MRAVMFYATYKSVLEKLDEKERALLIKLIETMP